MLSYDPETFEKLLEKGNSAWKRYEQCGFSIEVKSGACGLMPAARALLLADDLIPKSASPRVSDDLDSIWNAATHADAKKALNHFLGKYKTKCRKACTFLEKQRGVLLADGIVNAKLSKDDLERYLAPCFPIAQLDKRLFNPETHELLTTICVAFNTDVSDSTLGSFVIAAKDEKTASARRSFQKLCDEAGAALPPEFCDALRVYRPWHVKSRSSRWLALILYLEGAFAYDANGRFQETVYIHKPFESLVDAIRGCRLHTDRPRLPGLCHEWERSHVEAKLEAGDGQNGQSEKNQNQKSPSHKWCSVAQQCSDDYLKVRKREPDLDLKEHVKRWHAKNRPHIAETTLYKKLTSHRGIKWDTERTIERQ